MTTQVNPPSEPRNSKTTRVVGTIAKEPEHKVSKSGNPYVKLTIIVDNGIEGATKTWWNANVMMPLVEKIGRGFFSKGRYAKFVGLGTAERKYKKADGTDGSSNDLLSSAVELQDGTFVRLDKKTDDEDAPL